MRIEPKNLSQGSRPGTVRVGASIAGRRGGPEELWFEVPEAMRADLSDTATAWAQAILPLAFHQREPLEIAGPIDLVWRDNARERMRVWARWHPEFQPVEICASALLSAREASPGRTGLFFTGGIDSFHSLLDHDRSAAADPASGRRPVDDLVYVLGYDIPLRKRGALGRKTRALAEIARRLGKNLVILGTNLRETQLGLLDWGRIMHGPALGTAGLLLEKRFGSILFSASSNHQDDATPWGTHPLLDEKLSSARTRFVRYGGEVSRFDKTRVVAQSEAALGHLHVCWVRKAEVNCGVCEKCVRTQLTLELLGVRDRAACFPPGSLPDRLRAVKIKNALTVPLWEELKSAARACGRTDLARLIEQRLGEACWEQPAVRAGWLRCLERRLRAARKGLFR